MQSGYAHGCVNHKQNFVDPITGVHTQNIERLWGSMKWANKVHRGTLRSHMDIYLDEFVWRKSQAAQGMDPFIAMLGAIASLRPPMEDDSKILLLHI